MRTRLAVESLESRRLLTADVVHNFLDPLDVNDDQKISSIDALAVINYINRNDQQRSEANSSRFFDVSDDAAVTPIDALRVVNYLNRQASEAVDRIFAQLGTIDGARMRAEFIQDRVRQQFEIRLQDGVPRQTYPVLVDGVTIGNIVADDVGRGVLRLASDIADQAPTLGEIANHLRGGINSGRLIHVDGLGGVLLGGEGEPIDIASTGSDAGDNGEIRIPDFGMLPRLQDISGPVFAATLNGDGHGAAYVTNLDDGFSIGLVARGFVADMTYDVSVDGVVVTTVTAGRFGVVSLLYNSTHPNATAPLNPLPELSEGVVIAVGSSDPMVSGSLRPLEIPQLRRIADRIEDNLPGIFDSLEQTLVAPLDGGSAAGWVTLAPKGASYELGVALRGAARREAYEITIDGIVVSTVRSNFIGAILHRQTLSDSVAQQLANVGEDSVVEIRGLASGEFHSVADGIRDFLNR
jgi:hypothetical protein